MSHTQHLVPHATVCLCSLYTEQSFNYFGQKLTFFFKFNKFKSLKLFFRDVSLSANFLKKIKYVFQLRTEVQLYQAVDTKSYLKLKAFSPDTEVIEWEQVTEMLNKPIMLNFGQIILSKVPASRNIV